MSANRKEFVEYLCSLVMDKKEKDKPLIVGITGVDTSGKTELTAELETILKESHAKVQTIHVDDFHHPKSKRYVPSLPEIDQYYNLSIDFEKLKNELLMPINLTGEVKKRLTHLDLLTDSYSISKNYEIDSHTIVLLEGVFLFREEVRLFVDFSIYLTVQEETILERARIRNVPIEGEGVMLKYHNKYIPAQKRYIAACKPEENADIVIDNTNIVNPQILIHRKRGVINYDSKTKQY